MLYAVFFSTADIWLAAFRAQRIISTVMGSIGHVSDSVSHGSLNHRYLEGFDKLPANGIFRLLCLLET